MTDEEMKIYSMLGMAQKAGKLASGAEACKSAVLNRNAKLVIMAEDTAANTRKFFEDKGCSRGIPVIFFGERALLGKHIGKAERTVLAVLDDGMARAIAELYGILTRG